LTVGLDLGDKSSWMCVLDETATIVEEARIPTTPEAMRRRFSEMAPARVALETGTSSRWVEEILKACGHEVIVANAVEVSQLCRRGSKTDRLDAEQLARLARADPKLLRPIRHRSEQTQASLAVLRARDVLVAARTRLVNHVRGTLKSFGVRAKRCSTPSFHRQAVASIPPALEPALLPVLEELESLTRRIAQYDKQIEQLCTESYGETALLRQVRGVGPVTALAYVLTLEEPRRFASSRSVGAYLGLRPRKRQSGECQGSGILDHPQFGYSGPPQFAYPGPPPVRVSWTPAQLGSSWTT
jgi:transposase